MNDSSNPHPSPSADPPCQQFTSQEMEEEMARLRRLGLFSAFLAALVVSFLFLPRIVPVGLLLGGFLYVCGPCLYPLVLTALSSSKFTSVSIWDAEPMAYNDPANDDDDDDDADIENGHSKTPSQVRQCSLPRPTGKDPPEGIYDVVYAAEYFGRPLRTQGLLHVRWQPVAHGWELVGHVSAAAAATNKPTRVHEGFLNAQGDLYWIVEGTSTGGKPIVYRGHFDLDTHQMHEGEFQSIDNDRTLHGRIVRMQLAKATPIELLPPPPNQPDDDGSLLGDDGY